MKELIIKWLQTCDESLDTKMYEAIRPSISAMIKSNELFRINKFTSEEAEEWTNEIIITLNRVKTRIEPNGFVAYTKTTIRRFLIDRINEKRNDVGIIPIIEELSEKHIGTIDEILNTNTSYDQKLPNWFKPYHETNLFKYLNSESNNTFKHLKKWIIWNNKKNGNDNSENIIQKTDLSRIGFTVLEESGYNIYINPTSILAKYDLWLNHNLDERNYMWWAIDEMKKSKKESDKERIKIDPLVGAILVDNNGLIIASAYRGSHDPKGHCEYNLLQHDIKQNFIKRRYFVEKGLPGEDAFVTELNIENATLYVTLEPCSSRKHGKCSCADRIIYSGIKTVYIGLKDPDSSIDGSGIRKLEEAGINVKYFHQDLLFEIIKAKNGDDQQQNLDFIISKKPFYISEQPELFINNILRSNQTFLFNT